jgi:hypothetical protein
MSADDAVIITNTFSVIFFLLSMDIFLNRIGANINKATTARTAK